MLAGESANTRASQSSGARGFPPPGSAAGQGSISATRRPARAKASAAAAPTLPAPTMATSQVFISPVYRRATAERVTKPCPCPEAVARTTTAPNLAHPELDRGSLTADLCFQNTWNRIAFSDSSGCSVVGQLPDEGQVAQLVEQRTENPCVGGSIPPLATRLHARSWQHGRAFFVWAPRQTPWPWEAVKAPSPLETPFMAAPHRYDIHFS